MRILTTDLYFGAAINYQYFIHGCNMYVVAGYLWDATCMLLQVGFGHLNFFYILTTHVKFFLVCGNLNGLLMINYPSGIGTEGRVELLYSGRFFLVEVRVPPEVEIERSPGGGTLKLLL